MAKPLSVGLSLLHKCMSQQQGNESLQLASEICEYFDKTLSVAELGNAHFQLFSYMFSKNKFKILLDLAVNDVFLSSNSLLASLQKSLTQRKAHKNANIKMLELIYNLIEKYKMKMNQYAKLILEVSFYP